MKNFYVSDKLQRICFFVFFYLAIVPLKVMWPVKMHVVLGSVFLFKAFACLFFSNWGY